VGKLEEFTLNFIAYEDLLRAKKEANRLKDQLDVLELQKIHAKKNAD
jgi:hypothetical protein